MDTRYDDTYFTDHFVVVCGALCAKVVGATSSEGCLVFLCFYNEFVVDFVHELLKFVDE